MHSTAAHIFHIYKSHLPINWKKQLPDHGNIIYSGTLTALYALKLGGGGNTCVNALHANIQIKH